MIEKGKCKTCGASEALEYTTSEARCKYCGSVFYHTPWNKLNPFAQSQGAGSRSTAYLWAGISVILFSSLFAAYLDSPGWFRSDFAIAIWSAIIPVFTLAWVFNLHPEKRSKLVFALAVLCNALPFLLSVIIRQATRISSDDLWGITALFAGCSVAAFAIGAILNNFRKQN